MAEDVVYDEMKEKIIAYLRSLTGKGTDTIVGIAKGTGLHRREVSKILSQMEVDGLIMPAGVMAGVAGYKLKT